MTFHSKTPYARDLAHQSRCEFQSIVATWVRSHRAGPCWDHRSASGRGPGEFRRTVRRRRAGAGARGVADGRSGARASACWCSRRWRRSSHCLSGAGRRAVRGAGCSACSRRRSARLASPARSRRSPDRAARWRMRAALAALGYWWLVLAEPLLARRLWLGPPAGTPRAGGVGGLADTRRRARGRPAARASGCCWAPRCGPARRGAACRWLVRGRERGAGRRRGDGLVGGAAVGGAGWSTRGAAAHAVHASPRGASRAPCSAARIAVAARALRAPSDAHGLT